MRADGQPRPRRPRPPRPGRRPLRRDGGGGPPRRPGVAPPRLHLPGAAARRDRARARPTTTSTCAPLATEAAAMVGLLDDAAEHGDQWLAHARARATSPTRPGRSACACASRSTSGDLAGMARFTDELIATVDQVPADEERARAMTYVAQSHRLLDRVGPHLRVGRQGARDRHAERLRGRAPGGDGGEGLGARGRAGHRRRGRGPPRGGRRRGRAHRRPRPRRPGARAASCGWPACRAASTTPATLVAADAQARRGRRVRLAGQLRAGRGHRVAGGRRRRPRRRPRGARAAAPRRSRAPPRPATGAGCPCCAPGSPSRPATCDAAAELTEAAKPVTAAQPGGRARPRRPPRRPPGRPAAAREQLAELLAGDGRGGLRARRPRCTTSLAGVPGRRA